MSFACMLGPWTPKKASFCKNLLLCHFPAFFSIVFKEQPILFVRKWAQWYVRPVFLQCWQKVKRSYPFFFCPRVELCWKARLTRTSGMALHLVVATQPAKIPTKWPLKSTGIPYKMNGPNPAKFSNCILRLLCDSDFMRKGVNPLFYCSYNMARCRQVPPTKWPPKP